MSPNFNNRNRTFTNTKFKNNNEFPGLNRDNENKERNTLMVKIKKRGFDKNKYYGDEIFSITNIVYTRCFNTFSLIKYQIPKTNKDYFFRTDTQKS